MESRQRDSGNPGKFRGIDFWILLAGFGNFIGVELLSSDIPSYDSLEQYVAHPQLARLPGRLSGIHF